MSNEQHAIRIDVPRHLQDFNGYCGPACALMVVDFAGSKKSPPVFAQNDFFREIRSHAKQASDKRPIKSPAESLLSLINNHADGATQWEKVYQTESAPVAEAILEAIAGQGQPCMIMINRGMHWVVAFGFLKKEDGSPSGLLMRDPAWAGMPRFYGLSIFPDEPTITHCNSPCSCLEATDSKENKRTGKVNERFFTMEELLSHRGLQGSLDWEGKGAIALIPEGTQGAAARLPASMVAGVGAVGAPVANALENAGEAALAAVRDSGLTGREDSPPEWDQALVNARAGDPILVKDPEDSRDDFYLVPLIPQDPKAPKGAWAMLDAQTLALREVSLLEDWQTPILPTQQDSQQASQEPVSLPDGTTAKFQPSDLTPNTKNLVWQPSAAAVLPYWPVKEFTAPHPVSGDPLSVYLTQDGKPHGHLGPDEDPHPESKPPSNNQPNPTPAKPKPNRLKKIALTTAVAAGIPAGIWVALSDTPSPSHPTSNVGETEDSGFSHKEPAEATESEAVEAATAVTDIAVDATPSQTTTSANLLSNPDFELQSSLPSFGGVVDDFSVNPRKWGAERGRFSQSTDSINPLGSKMFGLIATGGSHSQAIQITNLAEYSSEIATGDTTFNLRALLNSKVSGATGGWTIHFFTTGWGAQAGPVKSKSIVLDGNPGTWEQVNFTGKIPKGTAWIGSELQFTNSSLKGDIGYVDQTSLTITTPKP
ncbi:MAG: hypothetical protein ACSHYB_16850 [Roseibacillus sp.]